MTTKFQDFSPSRKTLYITQTPTLFRLRIRGLHLPKNPVCLNLFNYSSERKSLRLTRKSLISSLNITMNEISAYSFLRRLSHPKCVRSMTLTDPTDESSKLDIKKSLRNFNNLFSLSVVLEDYLPEEDDKDRKPWTQAFHEMRSLREFIYIDNYFSPSGFLLMSAILDKLNKNVSSLRILVSSPKDWKRVCAQVGKFKNLHKFGIVFDRKVEILPNTKEIITLLNTLNQLPGLDTFLFSAQISSLSELNLLQNVKPNMLAFDLGSVCSKRNVNDISPLTNFLTRSQSKSLSLNFHLGYIDGIDLTILIQYLNTHQTFSISTCLSLMIFVLRSLIKH